MSKKKNRHRKHPYNPTPWVKQDLDQIFTNMAKKYKLPKLLLKAVAQVESALDPNAYRFEPKYWVRYMKDDPIWRGKDPKIVSASYGLMQILVKTSWDMGFRGKPEDLYDPLTNINLGAKLLKANIEMVTDRKIHIKHQLFPVLVAICWYNGGSRGNPDHDGSLRNQSYADKVFEKWYHLEIVEGKK